MFSLEGITSREKIERLNLQAILGSLTEGVLVGNLEGRIVLANEELLRMFSLEGSPESTIRSRAWAAAMHPKDVGARLQLVELYSENNPP